MAGGGHRLKREVAACNRKVYLEWFRADLEMRATVSACGACSHVDAQESMCCAVQHVEV